MIVLDVEGFIRYVDSSYFCGKLFILSRFKVKWGQSRLSMIKLLQKIIDCDIKM